MDRHLGKRAEETGFLLKIGAESDRKSIYVIILNVNMFTNI